MLEKSRTSPLVSVIVPVFNGEQFLPRCLDSIFAQTMPDLEVIVVNDGSTDGTASILADYAARHQRLVVMEQVNAGQGAARNRALERARGEFVLFVDADDFIERVTLQVTTERALEDESDLVHFDWKLIRAHPDHNGKFDYSHIDPFWHHRTLVGAECEQLFAMHSYFSVTNLYRRSFLNTHDIRYETGQIYEDNPFLAQVFTRAELVSLVHSPLYAVQVNAGSSTKTGTDTDRHMRDHLLAVRKSFELTRFRTEQARSDLAEYHLEKFSIYFARRVPQSLRSEYSQQFVDSLGSQQIELKSGGRATSWLTSACIRAQVFPRRRVGLLQKLVETKHAVTPPAKRALSAARKAKRRVAHPLLTVSNMIHGRHPTLAKGTILFLGFDWRYTGNSRALYEELIADERFADRTILFATTDEAVPERHRVKPESIRFTRFAQSAEYVIAETWIPAAIPKHPDSTWVQLWHGTPIKRMLFDSHEREITRANPRHKVSKYKDIQRWDYFLVDSAFAMRVAETSFLLDVSALRHGEYPRVARTRARRASGVSRSDILGRIGVTDEALGKLALYAPTWRDNNFRRGRAELNDCYLLSPAQSLDLLGEGWNLLYHTHQYVEVPFPYAGQRAFDASVIDFDDLLAIADLLISDYSSSVADAKSLGIPTMLWRPDEAEYAAMRGIYAESTSGEEEADSPRESKISAVLMPEMIGPAQ